MGFVLDWERVNNRFRELESINHHWAAEMELAIIFGEYELAEYLEGVIESSKRRKDGFSLNEWNDIYNHFTPPLCSVVPPLTLSKQQTCDCFLRTNTSQPFR